MTATGISDLDKTQIGVETTNGSSSDLPTTTWRGSGTIKDDREIRFIKQKVGRIGGTTRTTTPKTGGTVVLEDDAAFEMLGHLFNAAFYLTTAAQDGAGSGWIRQWSAQSASSDPCSSSDLKTLVIETGDNISAEIAHYCYVEDYELSGKQGEPLHIVANLKSQSPAPGSFTAVGATDLNNPYETINTGSGLFYIDPSTDTAGTTQISDSLIDFSLKHTTGWVPKPVLAGRTDFADIKHVGDDITLDVTFEHTANADTEKVAWRAMTEKVLRLKFVGEALASTGTTYDTKILIVDMWGKWEKFGADGLADANGDNTYTGTFRVAWAENGLAKMNVTLVTEQSALP